MNILIYISIIYVCKQKNESCIKKNNDLKKYIESIKNYNDLIKITNKLYDSAYTINDIINYIEKTSFENNIDKTLLILITQKIKCELRNEKNNYFIYIKFNSISF